MFWFRICSVQVISVRSYTATAREGTGATWRPTAT